MFDDRTAGGVATPAQMRAAIGIALTCVLALAPAAVAATFEPLPHPDGLRSEPVAASADGRFLLVNVFQTPTSGHIPSSYRWNNGVVEPLPCIFATDMSDDGKTITAQCQNLVAERRLWVDGALVDLPAAYRHSILTAVSGDGLVVFGTLAYEYCQAPDLCYDPAQAFRLANGVAQDLGFLPGDHESRVTGASHDGSVAAFESRLQDITPSNDPEGGPFAMDQHHPARWKASALPQGSLLPLTPPGEELEVTEISADGTTLVGHWYRWTEATGLLYLDVPLDTDFATATGVSGDGRVIVGSYENPSHPNGRASIWREETGTLDLQDLLVDDLNVDLDGWELLSATDISTDASTIVGVGIDPASGLVSGWRVGLTDPSIVVNVTVDEDNDEASQAANVCDVDPDEPEVQCSLRAAINLANTRGGGTIKFDVPGDGVPEFRIGDAFQRFPPLSSRIVLDGTTQPGAGKVVLIGKGGEGDSQYAGVEVGATGAGSTIKGLVIHGFFGGGIALRPGADDCEITNNVIGTDVDGRAARGNGLAAYYTHFEGTAGVMLLSSRNTVANNVIAGNVRIDDDVAISGGGVDVYVGPDADFNHVSGNRIGVGSDGQVLTMPEVAQSFAYFAVVVGGGLGNVIGYDEGQLPNPAMRFPGCENACNIIGRDVLIGLFGDTDEPAHAPPSETLVAGNLVGVGSNGASLPGPHAVGLRDGVGTRVIVNTIGAEGLAIGIDGSGHRIEANLILEDPIGGINEFSGAINLSSADDVEVINNEIRPGRTRGIHQSDSERISIARNVISGRIFGGIVVGEEDLPEVDTAVLSENRIIDSGVAIDLGANGATRNDGGDTDSGPNDYLNFPVVNAVSYAGGSIAIEGFVQLPLTTASHTLEVFSSSRCNDSELDRGGGQAERYIGSYSAASSSLLGDLDFAFTIDGVAADHRYLSLTTSNPERGITSELSRCIALAGPDEVASADVPADGTGVLLDAQGATVAVVPAAGAVAAIMRGAAPEGGGKLYVTRYERAPERNVFADVTATGLAGVAVRPDAVAPRYWYISDRKLTAAGGGEDGGTFEVCLDPTNVVRRVALRSVLVVRRDEASGGHWVPYATTRRVRDDGAVYLCAAAVPALGEFALGGAPAAFSDGPADACSPPPAGLVGGRCACDLLPPLACDALPKAIAKPAEVACGKLAQASLATKAKKQKKLVRGAKAGFKKALKKVAGKPGRTLPAACRTALGATLRDGQTRLEQAAAD